LQIEREITAAFLPQPVRQPMVLDGVKALVVEHRLDQPMGGRIAIRRRHDVSAEGFADRRHILERIHIGLTDQFA
jgi:hypothetical protein